MWPSSPHCGRHMDAGTGCAAQHGASGASNSGGIWASGVRRAGLAACLAGLRRTLKQGPAPRRSGAGIAHCSRSDSTGGSASRGSPGSGASHRGFRSPRGSRGGGGRISRLRLRSLLSLPSLSLPRAALLSRGAASRGRFSRGRRSRLRLRSRRRSLLRLRSRRRSRLMLRLLQGIEGWQARQAGVQAGATAGTEAAKAPLTCCAPSQGSAQ
jgi:hypothetical protein